MFDSLYDNPFVLSIFFFILVPLVIALIGTLQNHSKRLEALESHEKNEEELRQIITQLKAKNKKLESQIINETIEINRCEDV